MQKKRIIFVTKFRVLSALKKVINGSRRGKTPLGPEKGFLMVLSQRALLQEAKMLFKRRSFLLK